MAERGGTGAERHRLAVFVQRHPAQTRVEIVQRDRPLAEDEHPRRGVVGDGIEDLDVPIGDPAVDDFERRQRVRDGTDDVGHRQSFGGQVALEDERDLGFDFGLQQPAGWNVVAAEHRHAIEKHAVVRLRDAQLALHALRRQPDLAADEPEALTQPAIGVDLLDRVRRLDRRVTELVAQRRDRHAAGIRFEEPVRKDRELRFSGGRRHDGGHSLMHTLRSSE